MTREPSPHRWTFVRARVVDDQMQIQTGPGFAIEPLEKRDELFRSMPRVTLADNHAVQQAHGGKQRLRPMSNVIVRLPLGNVGSQRQDGAGAVERLDIAKRCGAQSPIDRSGARLLVNGISFNLIEFF
jgi:hypothetical protein